MFTPSYTKNITLPDEGYVLNFFFFKSAPGIVIFSLQNANATMWTLVSFVKEEK